MATLLDRLREQLGDADESAYGRVLRVLAAAIPVHRNVELTAEVVRAAVAGDVALVVTLLVSEEELEPGELEALAEADALDDGSRVRPCDRAPGPWTRLSCSAYTTRRAAAEEPALVDPGFEHSHAPVQPANFRLDPFDARFEVAESTLHPLEAGVDLPFKGSELAFEGVEFAFEGVEFAFEAIETACDADRKHVEEMQNFLLRIVVGHRDSIRVYGGFSGLRREFDARAPHSRMNIRRSQGDGARRVDRLFATSSRGGKGAGNRYAQIDGAERQVFLGRKELTAGQDADGRARMRQAVREDLGDGTDDVLALHRRETARPAGPTHPRGAR